MLRLKTTLALAALFAIGPSPGAARAADDLNEFAQRLVELRGKVEALHDEIEAKQQDHRYRMNALAQRRASLDSEVQGKELQLRQLRQSIAEEREKNRVANESAAAITPALERVATVLTTFIDDSIPFKLEERQQAVKDLIEKVQNGDLSAPQGLDRLWTLYEDEFRITRENGLFRQEVVLDGKEQLSDVIRLGTMMLFFETEDGRTGYAKRSSDTWEYVEVTGDAAESIRALFSAFEKQVRSGYFTVPNALAGAK